MKKKDVSVSVSKKMNGVCKEIDAGFWSVIWISLVTFSGFYGPQPLLSSISHSFQVTHSQAGLLMTFVIAPFAVGPFIYGRILRVLSIRRLLFLLIPCAACTLAFPALATWFPMLLVSRLCQGVILAGVLTCLTTLIASTYNGEELQRKMTLYATVTIIGSYGGRVFCGFIGSLLGWRTVFIILAMIQLSAFFSLFFLRSNDVNANDSAFNIHDVFILLKNSTLRKIIFIAPICVLCHASIMNIIPFYLRQIDPSISDFSIGIVYATGLLSAILGILSKILLRVLRGEWNTLLLGLSIFAIAIPVFILQSVTAVLVVMLGTVVAFSLIYTTAPGLINRVSYNQKSITNSAYLGIYYSFSALGTYFPMIFFSHCGLVCYIALLFGLIMLSIGMTIHASRTINLSFL